MPRKHLLILLVCLFLVHGTKALDLNKSQFDSLVIQRTSLAHAVDQINKIHKSQSGGTPEFWILLEDPLAMTEEVSVNLNDATLLTILSIITSGTSYTYEITGNYIVIKNSSNRRGSNITQGEQDIADYTCTISVESYSDDMPVSGSGSGFVCLLNGVQFVVTNIHVIEDARSFDDISIATRDGIQLYPISAYVANDRDICIIRFDAESQVNALTPRANLSDIESGTQAYLYGNALGSNVLVRSQGSIKAVGPELIELDISAFRGNSGGPVVSQLDNQVIGVLTQGELIPRDDFTEAAINKLQSPLQGDLRIFATRIDNINSDQWRQLNWNSWTTDKSIIHQHKKNLFALSELIFSNSTDFDSITVNSTYLVECPELWRAYRKLDSDYDDARAKRDYRSLIRSIDNFIQTVDIVFMPERGVYVRELNEHDWDYNWFSNSRSGNTSSLTRDDLIRWYAALHRRWDNMKQQWEQELLRTSNLN